MGESEFDRSDPSYQTFRPRTPVYPLVLPVIALLVAVAIVSGLVFGGIIEGSESRVGPSDVPTTQPTILIVP